MVLSLVAGLGCSRPPEPRPSPTSPTTPAPTEPASVCVTEGFGREVPWNADGPYGTLRHDLADDFSLKLHDGTTFRLSERWTGCESHVFVPDRLEGGDGNAGSIWSQDLDLLLEASPENVHYFFVSTESDDEAADASLAAFADLRDEAISTFGKAKETWWADHVHVVKKRASELDDWVEEMLAGPIGRDGFAIDRSQRLRGLGSLADVDRYDPSLSWPWENNLAYLAHEVAMFDVEAARQERLDAALATVVPLFGGEVLSQLAEVDVALPSDLSPFDTFEIDIEMRCPDPLLGEFGNCGAWDYLAYLFVQEADESWTELARFITTYHREAHWVVDATPMLPHLGAGGTRRFKWEWAPYWNTQPTSTYVSLRFSDQGKGERPATVTKVATGGAFGSTYNDGRTPVDVPIPADAVRVELYAIVTGHGAGTNNCAEFCNHQHEFTVGGRTILFEFPEALLDEGCVDAGVPDQMTPNQWGTWWFGRGGWCPGQPVVPQVADVTADVAPGTSASVSYRGLFAGSTPPDGSGDIVLNAWIVTYAP